MSKFNIDDNAYVFCFMQIVKFKITGINVCKQTGIVDLNGYTEKNEPIMAPEMVCTKSIEELIEAFNNAPGQFYIALRPVVEFQEIKED